MRKIRLYAAVSLDGFIARTDGDVNWLENVPNPEQSDYGYYDFYASVGVTLMGNTTYQQIAQMGVEFPYTTTENYVFTKNKSLTSNTDVTFVSEDIVGFVRQLTTAEGKDIWLVGGAQINALFLKNSLIDEIELYVMPVLLGEGIPLFKGGDEISELKLVDQKIYSNGVVMLKYSPQRT